MAKTVTAKAHTNIALVKYWGKKDADLMLPQNGSISLTLDHFYTQTSVTFATQLTADEIEFNGQRLTAQKAARISQFLDLVRQQSGQTAYAKVVTENHVPTSAGLASSASGFAALAGAASRAAGLQLDLTDLSRLARRGSGSATRSIFGGFVEWHAGHDDASSYAEVLQDPVDWDIQMIAVVLKATQKPISSTAGMARVVQTSPYYPAWVQTAEADLKRMRQAIAARDLQEVGQIAETNAMRMHALNLSAEPAFNYFTAETLTAIQAVTDLRSQGVNCYYTLDAGPNVKIICAGQDTDVIKTALQQYFEPEQLIVAKPGPGITITEN
ncbi:diphosphomevalonate decarboxylase [Lactiplantibacillus pentosus]|jgi:diphosphomevalonate decarboxylase|uniref:diphosphomevalonate decarboxylase n=1 Tax=Lactiplantibacillus pentosus TaxID=1589 RepID=UPI000D0127AB|nr:diphosphomevalonate decarboxylase [Lactiplantibacillus pentosus]AYG37367.1 diphosphomevalonate decarboxylase [Lactiplantibacillus pentosus]AYG40023.1 diphosphomevalonate decarboxylase [Lactiplantibacillus pentosus]MCJ8179732.1 diphosphomevalonate decarboxylase [Lactiplantibacillus pentosus]PRO76983.1 diphosphomevalonate decarboxylase [Lactiplantibacillus pentosus]USJ87756.1 diphosphomevalonate decarboxylase [Lactiplantibacillus pentosus]